MILIIIANDDQLLSVIGMIHMICRHCKIAITAMTFALRNKGCTPHQWESLGVPAAWAQAKPATLIRSRLAKYCSKDTAVLSFLGDVLEARRAYLRPLGDGRWGVVLG